MKRDNYCRTFGPSSPCNALHTKKTRQYFYEPEEGFCMAMVNMIQY